MSEQQLQVETTEIEPMLAELHELVTPDAWHRVEQVVSRLVRLYGAGLERALAHARAAGAFAPAFDELVGEDALLASLLVLHGLHPLPTIERVRRAVETVGDALGFGDGDITILDVGDGVVRLRTKTPVGGSIAARVLGGALRHAIQTAAPEIDEVDIAGLGADGLVRPL